MQGRFDHGQCNRIACIGDSSHRPEKCPAFRNQNHAHNLGKLQTRQGKRNCLRHPVCGPQDLTLPTDPLQQGHLACEAMQNTGPLPHHNTVHLGAQARRQTVGVLWVGTAHAARLGMEAAGRLVGVGCSRLHGHTTPHRGLQTRQTQHTRTTALPTDHSTHCTQTQTVRWHALSHRRLINASIASFTSELERTLLRTLLVGALWTAVRAYQRGLITSPLCPYCKATYETEEHMLWHCTAWAESHMHSQPKFQSPPPPRRGPPSSKSAA